MIVSSLIERHLPVFNFELINKLKSILCEANKQKLNHKEVYNLLT